MFFWWGGGPSGAVTQGCIKSAKKNKHSVKIYNYLSFLAFTSTMATKDGRNGRKKPTIHENDCENYAGNLFT